MDQLVIATHNQGKLRELKALLEPIGVQVSSAAEHKVPEPEETGESFAENAALKARHSASITGLPALADDSGLCVEALDGAPGIYSARWAGAAKDFGMAMQRIEQELDGKPSNAHFVCELCLAWPNGTVEHFTGTVHGALTFPPRGEKGFGYDPIFVPNGHDVTFAEMEPQTKEGMSHRAHAFKQFVAFLESRKAA